MANVATGGSFETYLIAARKNIDAMVKLAIEARDTKFADAASNLLTAFDDYAGDCQCLIDLENEKTGFDEDRFWRDSIHALNRGMGD